MKAGFETHNKVLDEFSMTNQMLGAWKGQQNYSQGPHKKKRMKYPLHQSIHNEIMGANFPGSLRNKGATITEVLHHTVSELEDTIHVLDPPPCFACGQTEAGSSQGVWSRSHGFSSTK